MEFDKDLAARQEARTLCLQAEAAAKRTEIDAEAAAKRAEMLLYSQKIG